MPASGSPAIPVFAGYTFEQLRSGVVFVMLAISFLVYIEPAPADLMFVVVLLCFARSGLSLTVGVVPLAVFLVLYNIGGFLSFIRVSGEEKVLTFIVASAYMAVSSVFLAYYIAHDPIGRFKVIRAGLILGAVLAATFGMLDYLQIGGLFPGSVLKGRATGTFKDPNVFSTYLIFPAMLLIQGLLLGTARHKVWSFLAIVLVSAGVFFSFSRGAWLNFVIAAGLLVGLTFVLNGEARLRRRIVLALIAAGFFCFAAFTVLMSIESVRTMFVLRFSLLQSYDAGETGRFGNQLNAIPMLMNLPLGFGPLQFRQVFGADPHNTFLNSFSSYGWLGGITYFTMIISTIAIGLKTVFTKTPWQNAAIVVFCPLLATIVQGVQIDTEHWRHFYWMLGLMWGLFAATLQPAAVTGGQLALVLQRQ